MTTEMLLSKMAYGSKLYGTSTEQSDTDFVSVFLPARDELLLCRPITHRKSQDTNPGEKNGPDDVDHRIISLQEFVRGWKNGDILSVELAYGIITTEAFGWCDPRFWKLCEVMTHHPARNNLCGMLGIYDSVSFRQNPTPKELYHAMRAGFQLRNLYETGELKYPLAPDQADFLVRTKTAKITPSEYWHVYHSLGELLQPVVSNKNVPEPYQAIPDILDSLVLSFYKQND